MFFQYQIKLQIAKNSFYIEPSTSKEKFHNGFAIKSTIHYARARKYPKMQGSVIIKNVLWVHNENLRHATTEL